MPLIYDDFILSWDPADTMKKLHIDDSLEEEFLDIWQKAQAVGKPRAMLHIMTVDSCDEASVMLRDVRITSKIVATNLKGSARVAPFVATCGQELFELYQLETDPLLAFWLDAICSHVLQQCTAQLLLRAQEALGYDVLYSVNPGSTIDWPLVGQREVFSLLGDVKTATGIALNDSYLMTPFKSISGIFYHGEQAYSNCALCPRASCSGRREPLNEELAMMYGLREGNHAV